MQKNTITARIIMFVLGLAMIGLFFLTNITTFTSTKTTAMVLDVDNYTSAKTDYTAEATVFVDGQSKIITLTRKSQSEFPQIGDNINIQVSKIGKVEEVQGLPINIGTLAFIILGIILIYISVFTSWNSETGMPDLSHPLNQQSTSYRDNSSSYRTTPKWRSGKRY